MQGYEVHRGQLGGRLKAEVEKEYPAKLLPTRPFGYVRTRTTHVFFIKCALIALDDYNIPLH